MICTGGPGQKSKDRELVLQEQERFSSKVLIPIRKLGSASLDMAYVAMGRCDGFWQRHLKYWDIAAGIILVKESGGFVTDYYGENKYLENKTLLVTNSKINKEMVEVLK
jgi:myo-inositol-1(or 4)-monophosphatase